MQYASRVDVDFDVVAVAVAFAVAVSDATSSTSRTHMRQIFGRFVLLWRRRSSCRGQLINMHLVSSAERERQWQRESERQRVRQIERVRKTGNFRNCRNSLEICAKGTRVFRAGLRFGVP